MIFASQQGLGGPSEAPILASDRSQTSKGLCLFFSLSLSPEERHGNRNTVDFIN